MAFDIGMLVQNAIGNFVSLVEAIGSGVGQEPFITGMLVLSLVFIFFMKWTK